MTLPERDLLTLPSAQCARVIAFSAAASVFPFSAGTTHLLAVPLPLALPLKPGSGHAVTADRETSYAHNDPAGADPVLGGINENVFFRELVPFLESIAGS